MKAFVFLGPSLPRDEAARILDAVYLPPVQQGDLLRLLEREPDPTGLHVGIVDGYFETVPAVWHKEILFALNRGVSVYGAASMGALRAAELHAFGMVGVGTIFSWLRDGTILADDEVAVQHGPEELGYLPLSHALVDIRHGCARARAAGVIGPDLARRIIAAARALPYGERTHDAILAALRASGDADAEAIETWRDFVATRWTSLKAGDAVALLAAMREAMARPPDPKRVGFTLEETVFLDRLRNEIAVEEALTACGVPPGSEAADAEPRRRAVLLNLLVRESALAAGWEVTAEDLREEAARLCGLLGLTDTKALSDRLTAVGLGEAAFWAHLRDELFVRRLMRGRQSEVDREIAGQIRFDQALGRSA